jgi:hypothetical protein
MKIFKIAYLTDGKKYLTPSSERHLIYPVFGALSKSKTLTNAQFPRITLRLICCG